jgi:hypothetical protein
MKRSLEQTLGELADVVLAHAREHYSDPKYGWDHVVEAWERSGVMGVRRREWVQDARGLHQGSRACARGAKVARWGLVRETRKGLKPRSGSQVPLTTGG